MKIKTKKQAENAIKKIRENLGTIADTVMDCPDPYDYPEGKAIRTITNILNDLEAYVK